MMLSKSAWVILIVIMAQLLPAGSAAQPQSQTERGQRTATNLQTNLSRQYYALVIGNNEYPHLNRLKTAVNDAKEVGRVLREQYGFETTLLLNASRDEIMNALNGHRKKLDESARLIIYYAGHGVYDRSVDKAYWLPVDAERDSDSRWIIADDVTTNMKRMAAMQVLVISDSCYSGMLRDTEMDVSAGDRERYLSKARNGKARMLMSSGGNEPVADEGGGDHSVFANALLKGLKNMEADEFTAWELFRAYIKIAVAGKSDQTPEYSALRNSGHDSGDFVFSKRRGIASNVTPIPPVPTPAPPRQEHVELQTYTEIVNRVGIEMVRVPSSKFMMGSPADEKDRRSNEEPQHEVTISSFYMGKYEVMQLQWRAVSVLPKVKIDLPSDPSNFKGDNLPVEKVSWDEAVEFCERLSRATGRSYRLPTEAEWEYACRAGTTGMYAGNLDAMAWYGSNSDSTTHPVGTKQANQFGMYDMHGNVWEWCQDWYSENYYAQSPSTNPIGSSSGSFRVYRGGSWYDLDAGLRSAVRNWVAPSKYGGDLGFRLVRTYN